MSGCYSDVAAIVWVVSAAAPSREIEELSSESAGGKVGMGSTVCHSSYFTDEASALDAKEVFPMNNRLRLLLSSLA